jgi:hypothetical protein
LETGLRIGVVWHFVKPSVSGGNAKKDGKHRRYLGAGDPHLVRGVDPDLHNKFVNQGFAELGNHSIRTLETMFPEFKYFSDICHANKEDKTIFNRANWLRRALEKFQECDLILFDPDNGISLSDITEKHVHIDELQKFWDEGRSLVVYHHLGRNEDHETATNKLAQRLQEQFSGSDVKSIRFRRGTARAYFIVSQQNHKESVEKAYAKAVEGLKPLTHSLKEWKRSHSN